MDDTFTLRITIGGLCLLVQDGTTHKKAFILMPVHPEHVPRMSWSAKYAIDGQDHSDVIAQTSVEVSGDALAGAVQTRKLARFAPISAMLGDVGKSVGVNPRWFTDTAFNDVLAARVEMPLLSSEVEPYGDTAQILAVGVKTGVLSVVGRARLYLVLRGTTVTINRQELHPVNGVCEVSFSNVPPLGSIRPKPGDPTHVEAYFGLFKPDNGDEPKAPRVVVQDPGPDPDPDDPFPLVDDFRGVEPVLCTVGLGCPPGEPDCSGRFFKFTTSQHGSHHH